MVERRDFQDKQYSFAAHIRDPQNTVAPAGIEDRRMAVYRDLFFNNLSNLLGTFFPVIRKLCSDQQWRRMIRQFMKMHRAKTPYFLQLPEEFLQYLQDEYRELDEAFPFLTELAHYEYAELALRVSTDENDVTDVDSDANLLDNIPVKSKLAWAFAYHYPVHRISTDYVPTEPAEQPTYLAIYRRSDDKVRFMELNPVTAALLEAVDNNTDQVSGETLLRQLSDTIGYADPDALVAHGHAALKEMKHLEILTGVRLAG